MAGNNIAPIVKLLQTMGFENGLEHALRAKACFLPSHFEVLHKLNRAGDICSFHLFFKEEAGIYKCLYYDACYRKEIVFDDPVAASLDTRMQTIEWLTDFDDIEAVMHDLKMMDAQLANLLQYKYWVGSPLENNIAGIASLRSQYEISQRFYVIEGSTPISVDEAFRFLQSRWMEKQARKREAPNVPGNKPKARKVTKKQKAKR